MDEWKKKAKSAATAAARKQIHRTRQARWTKDHIRTASCKLTTAESDAFETRCREAGTTRYAVLRYMIDVYMSTEPDLPDPDEMDMDIVSKTHLQATLTELETLVDMIKTKTKKIRKLL